MKHKWVIKPEHRIKQLITKKSSQFGCVSTDSLRNGKFLAWCSYQDSQFGDLRWFYSVEDAMEWVEGLIEQEHQLMSAHSGVKRNLTITPHVVYYNF